MAIGYGQDAASSNNTHKQRWGASGANDLLTASQASVGASLARYVHQILTRESGPNAQSLNHGDSGGPLLRETSVGSGVWQVMGVNQNSDFVDFNQATNSGFARIGNVSDWIANPHNRSLPAINASAGELVYLQTSNAVGSGPSVNNGLCAGVSTPVSGQPVEPSECRRTASLRWELISFGGGIFKFHNLGGTGAFCMDINASNQVVLATCNVSSVTQQWLFFAQGVGGPEDGLFYKIENNSNGKAIAATPGINGGRLYVTSPQFSGSQDWMMYR